MSVPSVYIITLNWNGLEDTLECLKSLADLSYPAIKVVVVDNGSRGNQAATIEREFPDAVVSKQSENLGFCGGCNVGIRYAMANNAGYVMLLNNDTLVPPDLIEKLITGFETVEDAAAVSPMILEYPETEKVWFSRARWEASDAQFRLAYSGEKIDDFADKAPYVSEFACGCCLFAPTKMFETIGLLDERYFAFYEEAAWCARAKTQGLKSYVIPSVRMYHKVSKSTPGLVSTYLLTRNRLLWMKENLPFGTRIRSFSYLSKEFVWHLLNLFGLTHKYHSKTYSRAVLQGYKDFFRRRFNKWSNEAEAVIFLTPK